MDAKTALTYTGTGWILVTANSFEPLQVAKHSVRAGTRIRDWVERQHPETKEFTVPTICLVNGKALLRKDWDYSIAKGDIVNFIAIPQGWTLALVIVTLVLTLASIAVSLLMPVPGAGGEGPESDPVYSTKGQTNSVRLGEPIECCYGRNRIFPSLASRPFFRYAGNEQYQHSLFCIGQGLYDITSIQIGDTSIDEYQEVEYEVVPPGSTTDLFATNVYTSPEASGHTLLAPNEADYPTDGWYGPFSANPAGTTTTKLEVDLTFPKGLYRMNSKGHLKELTVNVEVQKREIDETGSPVGDYSALFSTIIFTAATNTAQRKTYTATVPSGRYQVRMRRVDEKNTTAKAGHDVMWDGLRAYLEESEAHSFGDVTLLAVKIRASNNLNSQTQARFNVIATRKLQIWHPEWGQFSSEYVATRSIVWALVDIFRAQYGGRMAEEFFDFDALVELDALYTSRGEYFDWIFRDASTVWAAAQTVARAGRAIPLLAGSLLTMKRHASLNIPVAMFNQENMVQGSFEWEVKLWDIDEYDSIQIEYTEPSTNYTQEQVMCVLPGGTSDHPRDVRLEGVQDRTHAYRVGMYMLAIERYLRENITFETGLEGYIPTFGDLIAVCHDVPNWGKSGYIVEATRGAGFDYSLTLSEPVSFLPDTTYQIMLRSRSTDLLGPFTAHPTAVANQILIQAASEIDFLLDGTTEPMLFMFGASNQITKYVKVVKIEPQGGERIRITAVNEDSRVHSFDTLTPSALGELAYPPFAPDLPEVASVIVTQMDMVNMTVQVSWPAAFGATSYIVETSTDGTNYGDTLTTTRTSLLMQTTLGDFYVRVAAINNGQGPWVYGQTTLAAMLALEESETWVLDWQIRWANVLDNKGYEVKVYDGVDSSAILKRTTTLAANVNTFDYTYAEAVADGNVNRDMLVTVDVLQDDDEVGGTTVSGTPSELELSNAVPSPVTDLAYTIDSFDEAAVVYKLTWTVPNETDLISMKIWVSETDGFDPEVEAPYASQTLPAPDPASITHEQLVIVELDSLGTHTPRYWRVAVQDVWGETYTTNVTAQQTIPAYA